MPDAPMKQYYGQKELRAKRAARKPKGQARPAHAKMKQSSKAQAKRLAKGRSS